MFKVIFILFQLTFASQDYEFLNDYSWERAGQNMVAPFIEESGQVTMLSGGFLTAALLVTRHQTVDPMQESWNSTKPLGNFARWGDLMGQTIPNGIYALGMLSHYFFTDEDESYYRTMYMIEATLYSAITTTILKNVIQEKRPSGFDSKAFPSGRTTTAFAFATVIAEEHSIYYAIPAYALATLVGLSRINDNAHYLHDVVFGASIGVAYALSISHLNKSREKKEYPGSAHVKFYIFPNDKIDGLNLFLTARF